MFIITIFLLSLISLTRPRFWIIYILLILFKNKFIMMIPITIKNKIKKIHQLNEIYNIIEKINNICLAKIKKIIISIFNYFGYGFLINLLKKKIIQNEPKKIIELNLSLIVNLKDILNDAIIKNKLIELNKLNILIKNIISNENEIKKYLNKSSTNNILNTILKKQNEEQYDEL